MNRSDYQAQRARMSQLAREVLTLLEMECGALALDDDADRIACAKILAKGIEERLLSEIGKLIVSSETEGTPGAHLRTV